MVAVLVTVCMTVFVTSLTELALMSAVNSADVVDVEIDTAVTVVGAAAASEVTT